MTNYEATISRDIQEAQALHNNLVVFHNEVLRVVGINISDDHYYIVEEPDWKEPGKRKYYSMLMRCYSLLGKLDGDDYERLDGEFILNGSTGSPEFIIERGEYYA